MTFINRPLDETEARITVEPFVGSRILCVDGFRVGHALTAEQSEDIKHYLATTLEDLEKFFTTKDGARQRN